MNIKTREDVLERVKSGESLENALLQNLDFSGLDLSGARFSG